MATPAANPRPTPDVDQVVDAVLRRLSGSSSAPHPESASSLRLNTRVVTLAALPRSLDGIHEILAPAGAILTPAARDRLADARVSVTFGSSALPANTAASTAGFPLACAAAWNPQPLAADLARRGVPCALLPAADDADAVRGLVAAIGSTGRGAIVTDEPQIACCLANRDARIRAATAAALPELEGLLTKLDVNLLAVCPSGQSLPMLARLLARFATAPAPRTPIALGSSRVNGG